MATYGHSTVADLVLELDAEEAQLFPEEAAPASERRAVGSDVDVEPPAELALEADEIAPDPSAVARLCDACNGGQRNRRGGCPRCDGRLVRVWVANREVTPFARVRSEEEALGVVCALSGLLPELSDRARQGALLLFGEVTRRASPRLRTQAIAQWRLAATNDAFEAQMAGTPRATAHSVAADRWGLKGTEAQ